MVLKPGHKLPDAKERVGSLDGVRGLAILMVLFFHLGQRGIASPQSVQTWRHIVAAGWSGVDLFFVLSGFLITGILLGTRESVGYYKRFYLARVLRIFPLYYASVAAILLVSYLDDPRTSELWLYRHQWPLWTYTTNVVMAQYGAPLLDTRHFSLSHTWSLAIEEQFYLVWPVFVAVLGKRGVRHASVMMLLIAVAVRSLGEPLNEWSYYFTAYTHWDGLAAGAFLATLTSLREPRREYARLAGCGSTVLLSAGVWLTYHLGVWFTRLGYTFLAAGFAAGIYCLLAQKETAALSRFFNGNTLRAFGKYSYAIYLLHLLVFSFVYRNAPGEGLGSTLWKYALCLFGSLLVGYLSFALFERRWLALKDRILAART